MPTEMKLWEVIGEKPLTVERSKLDLEDRLEKWIEQDISIISDKLLVIGRQVPTDFGGVIDLLCLDPEANTVILELKRHKTPRDIVAQALDYASWIKDLSLSQIKRLSTDSLKPSTLEESFRKKFGDDLPDAVNMRHRIYIVASEIDSATERENIRLTARLKKARLRQTNCVEDIDFRTPRGLDKNLILSLASCQCGQRQLHFPSSDNYTSLLYSCH